MKGDLGRTTSDVFPSSSCSNIEDKCRVVFGPIDIVAEFIDSRHLSQRSST
jgi:hypothetical protein